jgi:hypothetical protein
MGGHGRVELGLERGLEVVDVEEVVLNKGEQRR